VPPITFDERPIYLLFFPSQSDMDSPCHQDDKQKSPIFQIPRHTLAAAGIPETGTQAMLSLAEDQDFGHFAVQKWTRSARRRAP